MTTIMSESFVMASATVCSTTTKKVQRRGGEGGGMQHRRAGDELSWPVDDERRSGALRAVVCKP